MSKPLETWGPAEVIIDLVWDRWAADQEDKVDGPSLPKRVTDTLRHAGLLNGQYREPEIPPEARDLLVAKLQQEMDNHSTSDGSNEFYRRGLAFAIHLLGGRVRVPKGGWGDEKKGSK